MHVSVTEVQRIASKAIYQSSYERQTDTLTLGQKAFPVSIYRDTPCQARRLTIGKASEKPE